MSDGDALLAAIIADPADDTARLVYADWLQENGRELRARYIRYAVERERDPRVFPEGGPAMVDFHDWWGQYVHHTGEFDVPHYAERIELAPATEGVAWITSRGFVSGLECSWEHWLCVCDVAYREPIQFVNLTSLIPGSLLRWAKDRSEL